MAFNKIANFSYEKEVTVLNKPEGWNIYNLPNNIKTASVNIIAEKEDLHGFDIKKAVAENPDFLYVKIFAIEKDVPNDNADAFSEAELKKAAKTFVGVPLFTNHQNDDIEKARGECVHSWYDEDKGGVYIIGRVDKIAYPKLARGIESGYVSGTSMGCQVAYSTCSVCHNRAVTADDYCEHIKNRKNRKFSGSIKCRYHENPDVGDDEECPVCKTNKKGTVLELKDQHIYEHNFGLKFIENSFVVNPACHDCGVTCILHTPEVENMQKKVASVKNIANKLIKESVDSNNKEVLQKVGGVSELNALKDSMSKMEVVVKSMLEQKENVSMEYVSDLVKAMSDVQAVFDELNEMGYGSLPSPESIKTALDNGIVQDAQPVIQNTQPKQTINNAPSNLPNMNEKKVDVENLDGLGNITKPKFSSRNKEDFLTTNANLNSEVENLYHKEMKVAQNEQNRQYKQVVFLQGDEAVQALDFLDNHGEKETVDYLVNMYGNVLDEPITYNESPFGERDTLYETDKYILSYNPRMGYIGLSEKIENNLKDIGAKMIDKETKTAANADNQEVITEKQLDKKEENLHPRKDDTYSSITESEEQLGGKEKVNDTTSESSQVRKDSEVDVITEKQLGSSSSYWVRFEDTPDVITEKQWDDMSKLVSADVPKDYTDSITESQIKSLLSKHKFVGDISVITEKQLSESTSDINRWANTEYSTKVMKMANHSIADLMVRYNKKLAEVKDIISVILDSDDIKKKTASICVINSLPYKKASRENILDKYTKTASTNVSDVDALSLAISDNAQFGVKAEDVLDAISYAVSNKTASQQIAKIVEAKTTDLKTTKVANKFDAFSKAVDILDRPEDGKYLIQATVDDVKASKTDKVAFAKGIQKLAQDMTGLEENAVIIKVQTGENGELIIDVEDSSENGLSIEEIGDEIGAIIEGPIEDIEVEEVCDENCVEDAVEDSEEEIEDDTEEENEDDTEEVKEASKREGIMKEAQMFGGEMGGQGGVSQAPGAGATLPGQPQEGEMGVETFTDEPMEMEEEGMEEDNLEPLPPGSACPVCTSKDVDIIDSETKCNNCGSRSKVKVNIEVIDYKGLTPDAEDKAKETDKDLEGEGFDLSQDMEAAASSKESYKLNKIAFVTKITKEALSVAEENSIKLGSVSPLTGSTNTLDLGEGNHVCLDTGSKYKIAFAVDMKTKAPYAQWEWTPVSGKENVCTSCERSKQRFVKALSSLDVTEAQFDAMSIQDKVKTIKQAKETGQLGLSKEASKEGSVIDDYKLAYGGFDNKFPVGSCVEKLARRFGENAVALSGPCEGKALAECVCNRLKKADIYSDKIAIKVAEAWSDCDGDEECVTDQVRSGLTLREAASICQSLKVAVAQPEDFLADELSDIEDDFDGDNGPDDDGGLPVEEDVEVDPFEEGSDTITIELPEDAAKALEDALGTANEDIVEEEVVEDETEVEDTVDNPIIETEEVIEEVTPEDIEEGLDETNDCTEFENDEMEEKNEGVSDKKVKINVNGTEVTADSDLEQAKYMTSKIGKEGKVAMDLNKVKETLDKQASEKEIKQENAQDSKDIGQYTDGDNAGLIGNEKAVDTETFEAPRDKATMGEEKEDANPEDKPLPNIPSDKATMGNEELEGGDERFTGGDQGAGSEEPKTSDVEDDLYHMRGFGKSNEGLGRLADRILNNNKQAKKLEPKAPVSDDKDIQPISGDSVIGNEEKFDAKEVDNTEGNATESLIGNEKETIKKAPKSPEDHPEVFTGDSEMGNEELESEKTTKDKGTTIASGDTESEAIRVAGKMLENKKIQASELQSKINELKQYKPAQIKDIEKSIFASEKGLDVVSDGLSQAVIINEASNVQDPEQDFQNKLSSLFSLEQRNKIADQDPQIQLRKGFGRN